MTKEGREWGERHKISVALRRSWDARSLESREVVASCGTFVTELRHIRIGIGSSGVETLPLSRLVSFGGLLLRSKEYWVLKSEPLWFAFGIRPRNI